MNFKYDVGLSFAGEQRAYVEQVAEKLQSLGIRIFYDDYERGEAVGQESILSSARNLYIFLPTLHPICFQGLCRKGLD